MSPTLRQRFASQEIVQDVRESAHRAGVSLSALWRRDAEAIRARAVRAEEKALHVASRAWHAAKPKVVHLERRIQDIADHAYKGAKPRVVQLRHRVLARLHRGQQAAA